MRRFILSTVVLTALAVAVPALADDTKPLAGKSITVLLPSPQGAEHRADQYITASMSISKPCRGTTFALQAGHGAFPLERRRLM